MKEFSKYFSTKYLYELNPTRLKKNIKRAWTTHINPPKERSIYLSSKEVPIITAKIAAIKTSAEPKQVIFDERASLAYVSTMKGRQLQVFRVNESGINYIKNVTFEDQCVEVLLHNDLLFVTTTNFDRPPRKLRNKLWILDTKTQKIISSVNSEGNWSKLISANPNGQEILVSNWHSHNISVFDIKNPKNPVLKQILSWGEAPRGIAFYSNDEALLASFYSGNLGIIKKDRKGKWQSVFTSDPFDFPNYPGNMRHILIGKSGNVAYISNLGRNLVHIWSVKDRKFMDSITVGRSPNSMTYVDDNLLAVSCREESSVYLVSLDQRSVIGRSDKTGEQPTGLCAINGGFLVTCFKDNTLELHRLKR